jgi:hypothetical protein
VDPMFMGLDDDGLHPIAFGFLNEPT